MGDSDTEVIENKNLLEQAFTLYKNLITELSERPFKCLFNMAKTILPLTDERYFDRNWYTDAIQEPLREFLISKPIVELEDKTNGKLDELWFPMKAYSKEIREKLWQYTFYLFPKAVCKKNDLHEWIDIAWKNMNKITYNELIEDLAKTKSISKLSEYFNNDEDATFKWFNEVGTFIMAMKLTILCLKKMSSFQMKMATF